MTNQSEPVHLTYLKGKLREVTADLDGHRKRLKPLFQQQEKIKQEIVQLELIQSKLQEMVEKESTCG